MYLNSCGFFKNFLNMNWIFPFSLILPGVWHMRRASALKQRGIGSQVHYIPVHRQPYYRDRYGALSLPGADAYYRRTLSLPLFQSMTDADVRRVAAALAELVARP